MVRTSSTHISTLSLLVVVAFAGAFIVEWDSMKALSATVCTSTFGSGFCHSPFGNSFWRFAVVGIAFLPLFLVAEYFKPAAKDQPVFSVGFATDSVWFFLTPVFSLLLLVPLSGVLSTISIGQTISVHLDVPDWMKITVAILLSDLIAWVHHWARHKIPALWELHKIHHSQQQLNYFTTFRIHPLDNAAAMVIRFLPFLILPPDIALVTLTGWVLIKNAQNGLVHMNIKTNFGPLRHVFVTPQYHRVHHSINPRQCHKNFGETFVIWDKIFATQNRDFSAYPDTGISDADFPLETKQPSIAFIWQPLLQIVHPLRKLIQVSIKPATYP